MDAHVYAHAGQPNSRALTETPNQETKNEPLAAFLETEEGSTQTQNRTSLN